MASQPPPIVEAFLLTDAGQKRPHNEDFVGYFVPDDPQELAANGQLFIVADGSGGAGAGDIASQHAVRKVLHDYYDSDEADLDQRLVGGIRAANTDLYEYAVSSDKPNMGTTLVAALVRGSELHIANVGNSRVYLVRGQAIRQITQDHSLVEQLLREESITPQEARDHPQRSLLLRYLGSESKVAVDIFSGQLRSGDVVLLCSDGLTRYLEDEEIREIVTRLTGEDACRSLVRMAADRGGEDDLSVVLLHFDPLTPALAGEGTQPEPVTLSPPTRAPGPSALPSRSAAASLDSLSGKPKTLAPPAEPVPLSKRLLGLPWRDIAYGAGALIAGALVVLAVGYWLPSLGVRIGGSSGGEAGLPATTVSATGTVAPTATPPPTPEDELEIGQATALPSTITPTPVPTLDPNLTGPVEVLEGEFTYGATPLQSEQAVTLCEQLGGTCPLDYFQDAEPAVRIRLNTFYIDRTEVTNAAYRECVTAGSCSQPEGLDTEGLGLTEYFLNEANNDYPVVGVTWSQADVYCRWAGGRLPTEAEWEKAASWDEEAGAKRIWPWGQDWDPALVNYREPGSLTGEAEPVGSRPGNVSPYGVLDMAGNVAEWVADWYADDYYESLTAGQANPQGPAAPGEQASRVVRGGSWADNGVFSRTVHRVEVLQDRFNKSIGFRCAYADNPQPTPSPGAGASDAPPLVTGDQTPTPLAPAP